MPAEEESPAPGDTRQPTLQPEGPPPARPSDGTAGAQEPALQGGTAPTLAVSDREQPTLQNEPGPGSSSSVAPVQPTGPSRATAPEAATATAVAVAPPAAEAAPTAEAPSTGAPPAGGDAGAAPQTGDTAATGGGKGWLWWALGGGVAAAIAAAVLVTLVGRPQPAPPPPVVEAPPPEPGDIQLTVTDIGLEGADNASLLGGETARVDRAAATAAVEDSLTVLQEYLNAMFIEEDTRLSPEPLDDLLSDVAARAMVQADEQSLGAVGLEVERSEGEPVEATATVVGDGDDIDIVLLDYDLVVNIELADGSSEELRQHAEMGFVRNGSQWRVHAVDATLDVPDVVDETKADESSQSDEAEGSEAAEGDQ